MNHGIFTWGDDRSRVVRANDRHGRAGRGVHPRAVTSRRSRTPRAASRAPYSSTEVAAPSARPFRRGRSPDDSAGGRWSGRNCLRQSRGRVGDFSAGSGDSRPRDPHQAPADAGTRRGRATRATTSGTSRSTHADLHHRCRCSTQHLGSSSTQQMGVVSAGRSATRRIRRRGHLPAHHRHHSRRNRAGWLPCPLGRGHLRRRVLGPGASQAR